MIGKYFCLVGLVIVSLVLIYPVKRADKATIEFVKKVLIYPGSLLVEARIDI